MPYKTIAQLPPPVKNSLPVEAQRMWLAVYNSAFEQYKGDEMKCAAVAWAAVKKKWRKDEKGEWKPIERGKGERGDATVKFFLSEFDLRPVESLGEDKARVTGLPVLLPGKWHGYPISTEDLASAVANFATLKEQYNWVPGGWPTHDWRNRDARDRMATVERLYQDGEQLLMDLVLLGKDTIAAYEQGKLPYISAEVERRYTVEDAGKPQVIPGMTFTGFAWVDDPAVKAVQPAAFANAAEWPEVWPEGDGCGKVTLASWQGLEADAIRNAISAKLETVSGGEKVYAWVRALYEDWAVVEKEAKQYKLPFAIDASGNVNIGALTEVRQDWVALQRENGGRMVVVFADTTESTPMRRSLLPPACFAWVEDVNEPTTWHLPYRDADTSSPKTDRWGTVQRYTKAGPISCPRVRNAPARMPTMTKQPPDSAKAKLRAAAKACEITTTLTNEPSAGNTAGGAKGDERRMASLKTFFGKLLGFMSSEEPDPAELEKLKAELANLPDAPDEPDPAAVTKPQMLGELQADENTAALQKQVGDLKATLEQGRKDWEKAQKEHADALAAEVGKRERVELEAKVEGMVLEGYLAPANRDKLVAVLAALPADGKATFAAADGKTEEKPMAEAVLELVRANGLKALFGERGQMLLESADPDKAGGGAGLSDERIDAAAKRAGVPEGGN